MAGASYRIAKILLKRLSKKE